MAATQTLGQYVTGGSVDLDRPISGARNWRPSQVTQSLGLGLLLVGREQGTRIFRVQFRETTSTADPCLQARPNLPLENPGFGVLLDDCLQILLVVAVTAIKDVHVRDHVGRTTLRTCAVLHVILLCRRALG